MLTRVVLIVAIAAVSRAAGQAPPTVGAAVATPVPATKVEAFRPAAGTVMTLGYNDLGEVSGISVDARELRDTRGGLVRGVAVEVTEGEYRDERSFVDADELPELIRGIDALLAVKNNPTRYESFEVRYTTKGELQITAYNSGQTIGYAVRAGRVSTAQRFVDEEGLRGLRAMFAAANRLLNTQPTTNRMR